MERSAIAPVKQPSARSAQADVSHGGSDRSAACGCAQSRPWLERSAEPLYRRIQIGTDIGKKIGTYFRLNQAKQLK